MQDTALVRELIVEKQMLEVANDSADNNDIERPTTFGELLTQLESELEYIDERLSSIEDEVEKTNLAIDRQRIQLFVDTLTRMGVTKSTDASIEPEQAVGAAPQRKNIENDPQEQDDEEEAKEGREPEEERTLIEGRAVAKVRVDMFNDVEHLSKLLLKIVNLNLTYAFEDEADDDTRIFYWYVDTENLETFLSEASSLSGSLEIQIMTPKQLAIVKSLSAQEDYEITDWDGDKV